ncbi:hypothetical protein U1769_11905 [Sphingomonas sp. ZT3P38]|jgi:hypothetical protein|uniref:hypothetical protein n=1 Tax=Parasphingomonas zepuensis TaxID=3096161 RepID=UPI002FCA7100
MSNEVGPVRDRNAVVELRVTISPAGLLSIAAIVLAGAVVTGVAIREARRPGVPRVKRRADGDRGGEGGLLS